MLSARFAAEGPPDDLITAGLVFGKPAPRRANAVAVSALGFSAKAVASEGGKKPVSPRRPEMVFCTPRRNSIL